MRSLFAIAGAGAALAVAAVALLAHAAHAALAPLPYDLALGTGALGFALCAGGLVAETLRVRRRFAALTAQTEEATRLARAELDATAAAKRENDAILGAIRAHLMLIDPSYLVVYRSAGDLASVFHDARLGTENFLGVLQRLLPERTFKITRDYLELLFDARKKERTVLKVNPLDEVEVRVANAEDGAAPRYFNFSFRRIVENGAVARVLVTVADISERVLHERHLRESEQQKVRQFEMLIGILHVDPVELDGFVATASDQLAKIDRALSATEPAKGAPSEQLRARMDAVLRCMHAIKGSASLLRLEVLARKAHDFEGRIVDMIHAPALGGDEFLTVVDLLADFRCDLDDLQTLRRKLAGIRRNVEIRREVGDDLVTSVRELAKDLAAKAGKEVRVDAEGFDSRVLPAAYRLAVKDVLVQLTRNSIVHGIESPAEREAANKGRVATIEIALIASSPGTFAFAFRDDGRGLDTAKIRARAVAAGLLAPERAAGADDAQIAGFIFNPGFSTAETTTMDAGRGMGMSVVKTRVVDECGGEIGVDSEVGRYCAFSFAMPLRSAEMASA